MDHTDHLLQLKNIDWSNLSHAYADSAEDVARDLEIILSPSSSIQAYEKSLSNLCANLTHQDSIYDATAAAIPFLIAALDTSPDSKKLTLVMLLLNISNGQSYLEPSESLYLRYMTIQPSLLDTDEYGEARAWLHTSITELWKGIESFISLLTDPNDLIRIKIPYLITRLLGYSEQLWPIAYQGRNMDMAFAVKIIQELLPQEINPFVSSSLVFSLTYTSFHYPQSLEYISSILHTTADAHIRICAALNLAMLQQYDEALPVLTASLLNLKTSDPLFNN